MAGLALNPLAHVEHIGKKKLTPEKQALAREQKSIARRVAKFEAERAQEDGMQMVDMSVGTAQGKLIKQPKPAQNVMAPMSSKPSAPPAPLPVQKPAVQHVKRVPDEMVQPDASQELVQELMQEFGDEAAPVETAAQVPTPAEPQIGDEDLDVDSILKRFKGTPQEIAKQLAKSYAASEKRMRQKENEVKALLNGQPAPAAQPTAPQLPPVQQQIKVNPFDSAKWDKSFLDAPGERAKELHESAVQSAVEQVARQFLGPLYEEQLDSKILRKFGDVVNEDNLPVIKAMALREQGNDRWEKTVAAIERYKQAVPKSTPKPNAEVQQMQQAAATPAPQARTASGDKKMYKASDLRKIMQRADYTYNPQWKKLVDRAYAEGRVIRGQ